MSKQRNLNDHQKFGELILKTLKEKKKSDSLEGKCKKIWGGSRLLHRTVQISPRGPYVCIAITTAYIVLD